ncbi:RNA polymerase sigma factor [Streptacidiphilus monticola]|uniref:RNA polymerase sigma factor n=1 Tax=Streptacidiphilus monticola TaxID=2161674 RepID=A0ABW1GC16_9ACTN
MTDHQPDLDLVARAVAGEQTALEDVMRRVQDPVYRLALRMTARPADAEDTTQEILIRILTRLASYRGEAALTTWAYRVAANHLINLARRTPHEENGITVDSYRQDLLDGLAAPEYQGPDTELLAEEVRLICTQALLQCLDRDARAVYVLGDIVRLPGEEAAWALGLQPAAYRKRLERARRQVRDALRGRCGLLDATAPCRCARRINHAVGKGRIDPERPALATHAVTEAAAQVHELHDVGDLLRTHPAYAAPRSRTEAVLALAKAGRYRGVLDA